MMIQEIIMLIIHFLLTIIPTNINYNPYRLIHRREEFRAAHHTVTLAKDLEKKGKFKPPATAFG